jgi:hypothetical protein
MYEAVVMADYRVLGAVQNPNYRCTAVRLTKLADHAHFSGSILANANWLFPIFEFTPAPVPINLRHEAVECRRNRLRVTIFYPDTQSGLMFAFIDAGSWFAHFIPP